MQQLRAEAGKMNLRPQLPMSHSLYILSKTPVAKTDIFESPYRVHLLCVIRVQKYHFSEQSPNSWFHHPSESSMATLQVHGASPLYIEGSCTVHLQYLTSSHEQMPIMVILYPTIVI